MTSWLGGLPRPQDFFPPTPAAFGYLAAGFQSVSLIALAAWTPLRKYQAMGRTSVESKLNVPGRLGWPLAESVGPINLLYVLYSLPKHLKPVPHAETSIFGTGLPLQHELLGLLYLIHYINRAGVTPLVLAPSMSPMHISIVFYMATFQYLNSSCIASWIVYSTLPDTSAAKASLISPLSILGLGLYALGLAGNIVGETTLFSLRKGAARRKAKSEGKAFVTYDKVYVIPPAEGVYKYVLYPHYLLEWVEWTGYWILGGAWGLGFSWGKSAALWFLVNELSAMMPRAWEGKHWYEKRFGTRAVGGRKAVIPGFV